VPAYQWDAELEVLSNVFGLTREYRLHLSTFSLLPLLASLLCFRHVWRRQRTAAVLLALSAIGTLAAYYHPSFSLVRIEWANGNARFLLPMLLVAVPVSLLTDRQTGRWARTYQLLLLGSAVVHIAMGAFDGWSPYSAKLALAGGGGALLGAASFVLVTRQRSASVKLVATVLFVAFGVATLSSVRTVERRYALLELDYVRKPTVSYWRQAARFLEQEPPGRRIAVTGGGRQKANVWMLYYFLGTEFQHSIHYVPLTYSGLIAPFGPEGARAQLANYGSWSRRLEAEGITHIMSFHPESIELRFMYGHPERFERVVGQEGHWGLFRLNPMGGRADTPTGSSS
jgi:hypothetical protein